MAPALKTKSNIEFITKIMSVFEGFQYKGKRYLSYIQTKPSGDEFLIRDNLIKPLFTDALDYDKQKDFVPEESITTGFPDIQIMDANHNTIIVIETLGTNASSKEFAEHRKRLFDYTDELGSKIAVLANSTNFEAYWNRGRGKAKDRLVLFKFDDIYKRFVVQGIDGLESYDWENLLKLKWLVKELTLFSPEEVYKEPELDISEDTHFNNFLEQLQDMMEQVKSDVANQFVLLQSKYEEYQNLVKQRERESRPLYSSEVDKYKPAKTLGESFQKWQRVSPVNNTPEAFQLETMYIFFNRLLLLRICEDKEIIRKRQISNGGIKDWMTFKGFTQFSELKYDELLRNAYKTMEKIYPHLFRHDIFDWYTPDNEVLRRVLFVFNPYNFKSVDRDILGKLYEKYITKEERKKLGQFYTPEEVIDYILDAVGYKLDAEIEGKLLLDPACGSGGFLVRAAKILVEKLKRRGVDAETILNKVRDSIYGLDINPFTCHLAETNLLFQIIDLITEAKKNNPDFEMGRFNIFQTDSLRIPEKKEQLLLGEYNSYLLEDSEIVKQIKLKEGKFKDGFNFVVGNPPYLRIQRVDPKELRDDYRNRYESAIGRFDISVLFIEGGIKWLKSSGKLGFITSNKFMHSNYGKGIRKIILQNCVIEQLIDLADAKLFEAATLPCVIILRKILTADKKKTFPAIALKETKNGGRLKQITDLFGFIKEHLDDECLSVNVRLIDEGRHVNQLNIRSYKSELPKSEDFWHFMPLSECRLIEKIKQKRDCYLSDIAKIMVGIKTNADPVFTSPVTDEFIKAFSLETELIHPVLRGKNLQRWRISWTGKVPNRDTYIIYPHEKRNDKVLPVDLSKYPNIGRYLKRNEKILKKRDYLLATGRKWYEIWVHQDPDDFLTKPKIVTPDFSPTNNFVLDESGFFCLGSCFFIILKNRNKDFNKFILALLNSKLIEFFHKRNTSTFIYANRFRYWTSYMAQYPIITYIKDEESLSKTADVVQNITKSVTVKSIDLQNGSLFLNDKKYNFEDKEKTKWIFRYIIAKEIIKRVDEILNTVNADLLNEQPISKIEDEINSYVYKLYGINQQEVGTIENFLSSFDGA